MAEKQIVQDNIRSCQSDKLHHSADKVLHDRMLEECNKQASNAHTQFDASKADIPAGFPKADELLGRSREYDKNQKQQREAWERELEQNDLKDAQNTISDPALADKLRISASRGDHSMNVYESASRNGDNVLSNKRLQYRDLKAGEKAVYDFLFSHGLRPTIEQGLSKREGHYSTYQWHWQIHANW